MNSPHDTFAQSFDSIEIDPTRAPSKSAIDSATAIAGETPGFYMLDDGGGRFKVDRDMGVVSLKDESLLETERGEIHPVRLRVVEASGLSYELAMELRITGRVPQMVGADEFAFIADMTQTPAPDLSAPPPPAIVITETRETAPTPEPAPVHWTGFAAARAELGKQPLMPTRRAFIAAEPGVAHGPVTLALPHTPPRAHAAGARWSL